MTEYQNWNAFNLKNGETGYFWTDIEIEQYLTPVKIIKDKKGRKMSLFSKEEVAQIELKLKQEQQTSIKQEQEQQISIKQENPETTIKEKNQEDPNNCTFRPNKVIKDSIKVFDHYLAYRYQDDPKCLCFLMYSTIEDPDEVDQLKDLLTSTEIKKIKNYVKSSK